MKLRTSYNTAPKRGFTILEMLVVVLIMGIITTVVATLFARGSYALKHGEANNSVQRGNRILTARVTPYVTSAFRREPVSETPILHPTNDDPDLYPVSAADGQNMQALRFLTTEDFLAPTYPDPTTSATMATSFGDITNHVYQIRLDAEGWSGNTENVILEKLDETASFARIGDPQVLYFSRPSARLKTDDPANPPLLFHRSGRFHLIMEVTMSTDMEGATRTVGGQDVTFSPQQTFRTTFNLAGKHNT